MKKFTVLLISILCFGEINWQIEIVDSVDYYSATDEDFRWCSVALDTNDVPHIIYYKANNLIHAVHCDTGWQKEIVESGLSYYRFSLVIDKNNNPHLSYYRRDDNLNKFYLCYTHRNSASWLIDVFDSLSYWPFWYGAYTSLAIDTIGQPGIAYVSWNLTDSIAYIKYAHRNYTNWDTSVVEYDSTHTGITDWNPSLKSNSKNTPIIAFNQLYPPTGYYDTVKIAYFDDSLNCWFVSPAIYWPPDGQPSLSLQLDNQDHPCIALCRSGTLAYAWWNGSAWQIQPTQIGIGDYGAVINLDLDSLNNPHIAFQGDFLTPFPGYCYYQHNHWYEYVPFDDSLHPRGGISFALDRDGNPHIAYTCDYWNGSVNILALKYAKGNFVGIEENTAGYRIHDAGLRMQIFPNISYGVLNIQCNLKNKGDGEIEIYDATGTKRKSIKLANRQTGYHKEVLNLDGLASGIYFMVLKQNEEKVSKKFLLIR